MAARYRMQTGRMLVPVEMAAVKREFLKGRTVSPSEVVPSGNKATDAPSLSACAISPISRFSPAGLLRSTKRLPPHHAKNPRGKVRFSSTEVMNTDGRSEAMIRMSV